MTEAASDTEDVAHRMIMKGKSERKTEILKGRPKNVSGRYGELD